MAVDPPDFLRQAAQERLAEAIRRAEYFRKGGTVRRFPAGYQGGLGRMASSEWGKQQKKLKNERKRRQNKKGG